jgi:hypothetical protein
VLILYIAAGIVLAVIVLVCWQIFAILALVGAVLFGLAVLYVTSPANFAIALMCLGTLVIWIFLAVYADELKKWARTSWLSIVGFTAFVSAFLVGKYWADNPPVLRDVLMVVGIYVVVGIMSVLEYRLPKNKTG